MGRSCKVCKIPPVNTMFPQYYQNCSMFKFPVNDPERCQQWLLNLGLPGKYENYNIKLLQFWSICERHFTEDQFTNKMKNRLNYNAVPTLFDIPVYNKHDDKEKALSSKPAASNNQPDVQEASQVDEDCLPLPDLSFKSPKRKYLDFENAVSLLQTFTSSIICSNKKHKSNDCTPVQQDTATTECRVCGKYSFLVEPILRPVPQNMKLLEVINLHLHINISAVENLQEMKVCSDCMKIILLFHDFYVRIQKNNTDRLKRRSELLRITSITTQASTALATEKETEEHHIVDSSSDSEIPLLPLNFDPNEDYVKSDDEETISIPSSYTSDLDREFLI